MSEYTIELADELATIAEDSMPSDVGIEEWMTLQVEQAIMQTHLQSRQQQIGAAASDGE